MNPSVKQLNLITLNVGLGIHNGDWNWKNVNSPFARLYYVTKGTATIHLPQGDYTLTPHHIYLIPPYTTHSYTCHSNFEHYYIHIYDDNTTGESILDNYHFPVEATPQTFDLHLMQRLCQLNPTMSLPQSDPSTYDNHTTLLTNITKNKQRAFSNRVESRGIIFQLFSRFLQHAQQKQITSDSRIQHALNHIRSNIFTNISLDDILRHTCLSRDHFIRLFKREIGMPPLQYITKKKIEKAQLLLLTSDTPVKNIVFQLGYSDPSYFDRLFRRHVGVTPLQYREQNR